MPAAYPAHISHTHFGERFPEAKDADFYVKANAALHMEKFTVKPLPDKRVAEAKKSCRIMH